MTSEEPKAAETVGPIELTGMAHGGAAIGREEDGRAVFVEGGLPGEHVSARLEEQKPRWARAMLDVLPEPPSPDRVAEARCPHFGAWPERGRSQTHWCGGCRWQHVDYAAQLRFKADILRDSLSRIGGIADPPVEAVVPMADPWGYRNSLTTRLSGGRPSLVSLEGSALVPLETCAIAHPRVLSLMEEFEADLPDGTIVRFRAATGDGADPDERLIVIEDPTGMVDDVAVSVPASVVIAGPPGQIAVAAGRPFLIEHFLGRPVTVPASSFFQVNTQMAQKLAALVVDAVPSDAQTVIDAYCGVGTWALAIAAADEANPDRPPRAVWAIDDDPDAIAAAVENMAGLSAATLIEGDAAEGMAHVEGRIDAVIVDPPRGGIGKAFVSLLASRRPPTIAYVSCEPTTLARDAERLRAIGYRLEVCRPVDMFPQTSHIESVSTFVRESS